MRFKFSLTLCLLATSACGGGASVRHAPNQESYAGGEVAYDGAAYESADYESAPASPSVDRVSATPVAEASAAPASPSTRGMQVTVTVEERAPVVAEPIIAPHDHLQQQQQRPTPMLTAASVGDHDRRGNYLEFLGRHPFEGRRLDLDMTSRVRFRVVDGQGAPINRARVSLNGVLVGTTHADGTFDYFHAISNGPVGHTRVSVQAGNMQAQTTSFIPARGDGQDVTLRIPNARAVRANALDLAFVVDVTGSMEDELRYLNREVGDIVASIHQALPEVSVRVGAILYRDRTDSVPLMQIAMTDDVSAFARALERVSATGGGDYPEDLSAGLEAAFSRLNWSSSSNAVRVVSVIADAPPQHYGHGFTYRTAMKLAAENGIRFLPVAASGSNREVEYLFRAMATATSTPYLYLTDDSGIGAPHQEADTDRVAVEYLHEMMTRLLIDDLEGRGMHEPGPFGTGHI